MPSGLTRGRADLTPRLASLYFEGRIKATLSALQKALLVGLGLQRKDVDALAGEFKIAPQQTLAMFNKAVRKLTSVVGGMDIGAEDPEPAERRRQHVEVGQTMSFPHDDAGRGGEAAESGEDGEEKGQAQARKERKSVDPESARKAKRALQEKRFAGREKKHKR